jgi:cytochrome c peroxidase
MKLTSNFAGAFLAACIPSLVHAQNEGGLEWQLPRAKVMLPDQPILFVTPQNLAEWQKLPKFWNPAEEDVVDPLTGQKTKRNLVRVKMPLGLTEAPKVPIENPMTVARWRLGRKLYFDTDLSSDGTVSCASCHNPSQGFTDQMPVSIGIFGKKGGVSAPTVMNASFNFLQFWDGRALSLEDQSQGPPGNPLEMFDGKGNAWDHVVLRIRKKGDYNQRFLEAFGTEPTRDTIAKAIATYERTVFNGNSIHDRAEQAMRFRVAEEEGADFTIKPKDYAKVLKEAFAKKDSVALAALKLDVAKDEAKIPEVAEQISLGRTLFFNKARCNLCHVGQNFSDSLFHNLGVGVKDGKLPKDSLGRFGALPTGMKNVEMVGAFKTPTLRGLVSTAPYMHDGSEKTLEEVVDFYDRGGNAHQFLSPKMRDLQAENAFLRAKASGQPYSGPKVETFGPDAVPIVPFQLKLTPEEKTALVMFLRSLEGEVDELVKGPDVPVK